MCLRVGALARVAAPVISSLLHLSAWRSRSSGHRGQFSLIFLFFFIFLLHLPYGALARVAATAAPLSLGPSHCLDPLHLSVWRSRTSGHYRQSLSCMSLSPRFLVLLCLSYAPLSRDPLFLESTVAATPSGCPPAVDPLPSCHGYCHPSCLFPFFSVFVGRVAPLHLGLDTCSA